MPNGKNNTWEVEPHRVTVTFFLESFENSYNSLLALPKNVFG
jgi:hypothetical protein